MRRVLALIALSLLAATEWPARPPSPLGAEPQGAMRKAPYLVYPGTPTEMLILWQLHSSASCTIEWGTDTTNLVGTAETEEYGTDHQHRYTISDLRPATRYCYRISVEGESYVGSFFSAPTTDATAIKFMAYGDTRSHPEIHDRVAERMVSTFSENSAYQSFVLSAGDLVNNGDLETDWDDQFFDPSYAHIQELLRQAPYQSAMGNHERAGMLYAKYFPYPFIEDRYWSFDYGPAHFVVVDQYAPYDPGSAQLAWIENDLSSTTRPWKFICLHEPGWSAGAHPNNLLVQSCLQPLCEAYDVSIVFAGHNHYYARASVNGVEHVTTGGGGAPLYEPDPGFPYVVAASMSYHFCVVELEEDLLRYAAVDTSGAVIDSFSVGRTALTEGGFPRPAGFELPPVQPNPFSERAEISYFLPVEAHVLIEIYDVQGRRVARLVDGEEPAGSHVLVWEAPDVSPGVYFCTMKAGGRSFTRGFALVR